MREAKSPAAVIFDRGSCSLRKGRGFALGRFLIKLAEVILVSAGTNHRR